MPGLARALRRNRQKPQIALTELLSKPGTLGLFVELLREFTADETPVSSLIASAFYHDPDYSQLFASVLGDAEPGLKKAIRECFGLETRWRSYSDQEAFRRWQGVARRLEELRPVVDGPVFYGWAMLGVELMARVRSPRILLWNTRVAKVVSEPIDCDLGKVYADTLPWSLAELACLPGVGDSTILKLEMELVESLLQPERFAATLEEMMRPGFSA